MKPAHIFRTACVAGLLLAGTMQQASADVVTVIGDTTGGPTFYRPSDWGGPGPLTTATPYQAFNVTANASDWQYTFITHCEFNCASFFYQDSFDPQNPLQNLMGADGHDGWNLTAMMTSMDVGRNYVYVVAGYNGEDDWGQFSTTVGGKGVIGISAVPEPSSVAMLLAGLAGVGALARRRKGAAQLAK